jgi:hypothetical protein
MTVTLVEEQCVVVIVPPGTGDSFLSGRTLIYSIDDDSGFAK